MIKEKSSFFLRILDYIQQHNADARDDINKSVATICNEEGISFEQVFYILFFDTVLSAVNRPAFREKNSI